MTDRGFNYLLAYGAARRCSLLLLSLVFIVVFNASQAWACSCGEAMSPDGFVPSAKSVESGFDCAPARDIPPLHLPKNARGVLYYRSFRGVISTAGGGDAEGILLLDTPKPPKASDFTAVDESTGQPIEVSVEKLTNDPNVPEPPVFVAEDTVLKRCLSSELAEGCESIRKAMSRETWIMNLSSQGKVRNVTAELKMAIGIFRIEPKGGFTPGHTYRFNSRFNSGTMTRVVIDAEELDISKLAQVTLQPANVIERRLLPLPSASSCSTSVVANVQDMFFALPVEAERYREAMLFFFDTARTGLSEGPKATESWSYRSSDCSERRYGRGERQPGTERFYSACGRNYSAPDTAPAVQFKIVGRFGLLQVEDAFRLTPDRSIDFPALPSDQCSESSVLATIKSDSNQICAASQVTYGDPATGLELLRLVGPSLAKESPKTRACAAVTAGQVAAYGLPGSVKGEVKQLYNRVIIPELGRLIGSDPDTSVREACGDALSRLVYVDGLRGELGPAVPGLIQALHFKDGEVPVVAANVLIHIGKAGRESAESLRAIVTDTSTNNYCAPLALVAVDPDSPKTRAALLQALKHPDPIERSNAAYALAKLPADNTTISALIAAVSADKSNALDPLGMHRPAAIAMLALARIAPEHPDVLKVFVGCLRPRLNDNDSIGSEYIRSAAISSLGEMEIYARPAVPEMLKVLNENPTSSEVYRLLNALEQIGADPALTRPALMSYHSSDSMAQQAIESFITRSSR